MEKENCDELKAKFDALPQEDQEAFEAYVKASSGVRSSAKTLKKLVASKKGGEQKKACPYCQSEHFVKFGIRRGNQW